MPRAADDWDLHWSQYADAVELNPAQEFRRRLIIDALGVDRPRPRILDIGSGTGDLAAELVDEIPDADLLGLELSATGVEIARRKVPEATFLECDLLSGASAEPARHGWAEYAVCSEVLEHVDDPQTLIANARAYLAPGCRLVVTVPGGPMSAFDRHIGHRRHFDAEDLRTVLEGAGYEAEWVRAAGFPFFNLYRLAVIAAGRRLIETEQRKAEPGRGTRVAAAAFGALMKRNRGGSRLGFQTVALVRNPN